MGLLPVEEGERVASKEWLSANDDTVLIEKQAMEASRKMMKKCS